MKYLIQSEYLGEKKVKAKDVPLYLYWICVEDSGVRRISDITYIKHDNEDFYTRQQISKIYNTYSNLAEVKKVCATMRRALK